MSTDLEENEKKNINFSKDELSTPKNKYLYNRDDYVINNCQSPKIILISMIISVSYNLIFGILLLIYNEKSLPNNCKNLKWCNRIVYLFLFISAILIIYLGIIQIKNYIDSEFIQKTLRRRTIINGSITLFIALILTIIYSSTKNKKICGHVAKIDLVFIIFEWIIIFMTLSCFFSIFFYIICCKSKNKDYNENDEIKEEDMKKYI